MATLFPDINRMTVVFPSHAEELLYQLAQKLPEAWRVYYSCTLSMKEDTGGIREGEIDFVFYHPQYGVIVTEVKGGRVHLDGETGQFYSVNRHGRSFAIRNPFQQAIAFRNRFVRYLRFNHIQVPVSHAVSFPQVDEGEFPRHVNIEPATLLGRGRLTHLEQSLKAIAENFHSSDFLKFDDVSSKLDELLVGATFTSRPLLREYIDSQEAKVKEFDSLHEVLVNPVTGVPKLGIEGDAGTGKTLIAVKLAEHFAMQSQNVLMLVSSPLLAGHLTAQVPGRVKVMTLQELASSYGVNLLVAASDYTVGPEQWIQYEAPERLRRAIESRSERFDVLLVDEAQDVQPFWWIALEALRRDPLQSRLYTFFDRSQGVFGGGEGEQSFHPEDVLPVPSNYITLTKNYRNTTEIAQFAKKFKRSSHQLQSLGHSERVGYHPSVISYPSPTEALSQLNALVKKLHHEHGIAEHEMVILSARAADSRESVIAGQTHIGGLKVTRITAEGVRTNRMVQPGEIGVATIATFKGLEAKVVIAINFSEHKMPVSNPIMSSLAYVAFTRAKHMLYVFAQEGDDKHQQFLEASAQVKSGGSMILDIEDRVGEYTGKVTHHTPGRLAVLELLTGEHLGSGTTVIALASDLEAVGLKDISVHQLLRFRLKNEGNVATAVDLRLLENSVQ